ncbi:hypothetical protein [Sphingobium aquiterrae]|uniref:hypothetical protein n=1 Tax=Sphingobium aquiterrae TaxID=2038656 RepID=UPI003018ADE1|tara:strand:+ start:13389 stop:14369 length:981 start_codon:yes stop_codon:yes gene_type:complete
MTSRPRDRIMDAAPPPVMVAWGAGVDSSAMIMGMVDRGERIDIVLRARMPENPRTLAFIPIFEAWMDAHGIAHETVTTVPRHFKQAPPYFDLLEASLLNAALPSISLGGKTCSLRWKSSPQEKWAKTWPPAQQAWARGQKVIRLIGFNNGPRDSKRYAHAGARPSDLFDTRFPLRDWGWDRDACVDRLHRAGFEVDASSCYFCIGARPRDIRLLPPANLRLIVLMEARARPRLRTCEGLWRSTTRGIRGGEARPGSMTAFIRSEGLLDRAEIDWIEEVATADLADFIQSVAQFPIDARPTMHDWIERFQDQADVLGIDAEAKSLAA